MMTSVRPDYRVDLEHLIQTDEMEENSNNHDKTRVENGHQSQNHYNPTENDRNNSSKYEDQSSVFSGWLDGTKERLKDRKFMKNILIALALLFVLMLVLFLFGGHGDHGHVDTEIQELTSALRDMKEQVEVMNQQFEDVILRLDQRKNSTGQTVSTNSTMNPTSRPTIEFFEGQNFAGARLEITLPAAGDCKPVPKVWNDQVGSVKTGQNCVTVCEHCFCDGDCRRLGPGSYGDLTGHGMHKQITSFSTC